MWGLGNEVLHKIVHPAWVGPQDPARERNAEAFSDWLVETADAIHAADPDHPVTYRSAEDAFVDWVAAAFQRRGGGPRPWFVWGTNCYQDYLSRIVDNWPASGLDTALWVSEFAPGTMAVPDRPDGFRQMWGDDSAASRLGARRRGVRVDAQRPRRRRPQLRAHRRRDARGWPLARCARPSCFVRTD